LYSSLVREIDLLRRKHKFHYMQLCVTSNCLLHCTICPRTSFINAWNSMNMTMETYTNISRFFPFTENVYLSGWGEPLLNPNLLLMIRKAKEADCSVGFTTNGALLDDDKVREVIDLQTDLISFSFAGARAETHESIRTGSNFEHLTQTVRRVVELRRSVDSAKPNVLMLFMMTKQNVVELPNAVELAYTLGIDGIVATNLDYAAVPLHEDMKAFSLDNANMTLTESIDEARDMAEARGISFHSFSLGKQSVPICTEDPLNNVYISEAGLVSPCVYLAPPMMEIPRIFCGQANVLQRTYFGDINKQSLFEIWNSPGYSLFRRKYERRIKNVQNSHLDDIPEVCRTCYKAYGV